MSETKFTPGPWSVGMHHGHNASIVYAPPKSGAPEYSQEGICNVYGIALHRSVGEVERNAGFANAHLIASAPELYELLEAAYLAARLEGLHARSQAWSWLLEEMQKALKAARGEAPCQAPNSGGEKCS